MVFHLLWAQRMSLGILVTPPSWCLALTWLCANTIVKFADGTTALRYKITRLRTGIKSKSSTVADKRTPPRVISSAQDVINTQLPSVATCLRRASNIIQDSSHSAALWELPEHTFYCSSGLSHNSEKTYKLYIKTQISTKFIKCCQVHKLHSTCRKSAWHVLKFFPYLYDL